MLPTPNDFKNKNVVIIKAKVNPFNVLPNKSERVKSRVKKTKDKNTEIANSVCGETKTINIPNTIQKDNVITKTGRKFFRRLVRGFIFKLYRQSC